MRTSRVHSVAWASRPSALAERFFKKSSGETPKPRWVVVALALLFFHAPAFGQGRSITDTSIRMPSPEELLRVLSLRDYNTRVSSVPTNLVAGMFGFRPRPYFESSEGADRAPQVQF